jgi:hypothetical protein
MRAVILAEERVPGCVPIRPVPKPLVPLGGKY